MSRDQYVLDGKVALITGATKGMGLGIAERFALSGAKVMITSRTADEAAATAAALNHRHGAGTAAWVRCDIDVKADNAAALKATLDAFGKVTTLVCNACGMPWLGSVVDMPDEALDLTFTTVFKSKFWLSTLCAPHMAAAGGGSIIYISSGSAWEAATERAVYACMRAAEIHLMKNLAAELGPQNIRVNAISPGLIRTFSSAPLFAADQGALLGQNMPLRRTGEPEDIAQAAAWLASDTSSFTTGAVIPVDGGRLLHAQPNRLSAVYGTSARA
jgi:NAD(P)-dependent dehydrogenase (short-subunit alcohol dehydrogenase family)